MKKRNIIIIIALIIVVCSVIIGIAYISQPKVYKTTLVGVYDCESSYRRILSKPYVYAINTKQQLLEFEKEISKKLDVELNNCTILVSEQYELSNIVCYPLRFIDTYNVKELNGKVRYADFEGDGYNYIGKYEVYKLFVYTVPIKNIVMGTESEDSWW